MSIEWKPVKKNNGTWVVERPVTTYKHGNAIQRRWLDVDKVVKTQSDAQALADKLNAEETV